MSRSQIKYFCKPCETIVKVRLSFHGPIDLSKESITQLNSLDNSIFVIHLFLFYFAKQCLFFSFLAKVCFFI